MHEKNKKITAFSEYIAESTTACLVTMAQGNILAFTVGHLLIASQTGVIAGVLASVTLLISRTSSRWIVSVVLGAATALADFYVHPGMFGTVATEAIVTGVAAGVISYLVGTSIHFVRMKRAATLS